MKTQSSSVTSRLPSTLTVVPWLIVIATFGDPALPAQAQVPGTPLGALDVSVPPSIVQHLQSQSVPIGATVTFEVVATGTEPLSYQWAWNDNTLPGETNSSLILTNVQVRQSGYYDVSVGNAAGWAYSAATLEVIFTLADALDTPGWAWETEGFMPWYPETHATHDGADAAEASVCDDCGTATLRTSVTGPGVISFYWKVTSQPYSDHYQFGLDGIYLTELTGEVDWQQREFFVPAGEHTLEWVYEAGDIASYMPNSAWLDEVSFRPGAPNPPTLVHQPESQTVAEGDDIFFNVVAAGTEPFGHCWRRNGTALPGSAQATLGLSYVQPDQAGAYDVVVSNASGTVTSAPATLTVGPPTALWAWVRTAGGGGTDYANGVAADAGGNVYVTGSFASNLVLGAVTLSNTGPGWAAFVAKFDPAGRAVWARQTVESPHSSSSGADVIADESGHSMVLGNSQGLVHLGGYTFTNPGSCCFLARYDASGNLLWATQPGVGLYCGAHRLGQDASGNLYLLGNFRGRITFGTNTLVTPNDQDWDIFVAKCNPAGQALWAVQFGGAFTQSGHSLAVGRGGDVYFSGSCQWGPATFGTNVVSEGYFVAKCDRDGRPSWAGPLGTNHVGYYAVATDADDHLLVLGAFSGTSVFGTHTLRSASVADLFLAKYDRDGNVVWATNGGGSHGYSVLPQLTVDAAGNAVAFGSFDDIATFGRHHLVDGGYGSYYLARYDRWGQALWARKIQCNTSINGHLAADSMGNVYLTSGFLGWADIGTNHVALVPDAGEEIFLAKLQSLGEPPVITAEPTSQSRRVGQTATFVLGATGTPPLRYQWQFNNRPVEGATNARLHLPNVQMAEAGSYCAVVANAAGAVTSAVAILTVLPAPGSLDVSFEPGLPPFTGGVCYSLALQGDGKLIVGGDFTMASLASLARLNPDGTLDATFAPFLGNWDGDEGSTYAIVVQPDGKILIAGCFTTYNGEERVGLARVNPDATLDSSFAPQFNPPVGCPHPAHVDTIVLQPDGRILVAGRFLQVNGSERPYLARLLADGSLDPTFIPAPLGITQPDCLVWEMLHLGLQSDGRILVARQFLDGSGGLACRLVRLNADGSLDYDFNSRFRADGRVIEIRIQPDDRILIAGEFTWVNGFDRPGLARLNADGSLDAGFNPPRLDAWPLALAPDGKVVVGCSNSVVQLNPDGSLNGRFHAETDYWVATALVQPDGQVLIGGFFTWVNGVPRPGVARLNGDLTVTFETPVVTWAIPADITYGTPLTEAQLNATANVPGIFTYSPPLGTCLPAGPSQMLHVTFVPADLTRYTEASASVPLNVLPTPLTVRADDKTKFHGQVNPPLTATFAGLVNGDTPALWNDISFLITPATPDSPPGTYPIEVYDFDPANYDLIPIPGLLTVLSARTQAGSVDLTFDARVEGIIFAVVLQSDGRAIIGGSIRYVQGQVRNGIARLNPDGSLDADFNPPAAPRTRVEAIALQPDGHVLIEGATIDELQTAWPLAARLHPDGTLDTSFNVVSNKLFNYSALALQPDGKILLAGATVGECCRFSLVRFQSDGTLDTSFDAGDGADSDIQAIGVQSNGSILVGGGFGSFNGLPRRGLVKLQANGSLDATFDAGFSGIISVPALAIQSDGWVVTAANLLEPGYEGYVVRLGSAGQPDPAFSTAVADAFVTAIALQPDGQILIGGAFSEVNGVTRYGIARLNADGSLDQSFDPGAGIQEPDGQANSIAIQRDGQILIGGEFATVDQVPRSGIARMNNDAGLSRPFVIRQLPHHLEDFNTVRLLAEPASNVMVYAVEDQPPAGWGITNLSHGGVFDPFTGKVKFGPFFDHEPRTLSYQVPTPAWDVHCALGVFCFQGQASADGINSPIDGSQCLVLADFFPADVNPADRRINIAEVTAYGAAWRRGSNWLCHADEIPINYVTRAAALWRAGECYTVDSLITNEPLWWVNCETVRASVGDSAVLTSPKASTAASQVPSIFVPGEPITASIATALADSATAYAVEDHFPAGWTITCISHGGELDLLNGKVKWGPFLDAQPRMLTYELVPPLEACGIANFNGIASFDGIGERITGVRQTRASSRLTLIADLQQYRILLHLNGQPGACYLIETSTDLVFWKALEGVTCTSNGTPAILPANPADSQRFYRVRLLP